MKSRTLADFIKNSSYMVVAVLAGFCLFIFLSVFSMNRTVFNPEFHEYLFDDIKIHDHVYEVASSSLNDFITDLEKKLPDSFKQHMDLSGMLRNSVTPEMVKANLDSIRDGLFLYFSGKSMFFPDIYFSINPEAYAKDLDQSGSQLDMAVQVFSEIEKINLSTVLFYLNRNDISDMLFVLKFIYHAFSAAPGVLLPFTLLLIIVGVLLAGRTHDMLKWTSVFFLTGGASCIISGTGLILYPYLFMEEAAYPLNASLPMESEIIMVYVRDCILPVSLFLLASGVILVMLAVIARFMPVIFHVNSHRIYKRIEDRLPDKRTRKQMKITVCLLLCMLTVMWMGIGINSFSNDFERNNFASAIDKMFYSNKVTQVISAKDGAIYTVCIKLIDEETEAPVPDVTVDINGKSSQSGASFDLASVTDENGIARFTVDRGNFRASFSSTGFPSGYKLPSPFFFDMKTPGTTIITVSLEKEPVVQENDFGIIEIEVLDGDNKPVPELELTIGDVISEENNRYSAFSYTNPEGIAVFKVVPGTYSACFTESKFPGRYALPAPFDVTAVQGSVTRYTIRLATVDNAN